MGNFIRNCVVIIVILFIELARNGFQPPPPLVASQNLVSQNVPSQNLPPENQGFTKNLINWSITMINAAIYYTWEDALKLQRLTLDLWHGINDPIKKLGVLFVSLLLFMNIRSLLKQRSLQNKLAVYCPVDGCHLRSHPIAGSVNRYRCPRKHQFAGEAHDFHHI
ncbi:MAG: hypothetical protein KA368_14675 [Acidobacteria bacterium]|nr:hypothetical protein [Acidobacteriota bacterium]